MPRTFKHACLTLAGVLFPWVVYPQALVNAEWIQQHRREPNLVILDARPESDYARGHIPGAIPVNTYDHLIDTSPQGERTFHDWLSETFGRIGLNPKDQVVVYENKLGMRAARAYWMLWYSGQVTAYMLEGGLEGWRQKQLPVTTEPTPPRAATQFRLRPRKQWIAGAQDVNGYAKDRKAVILDVRTRDEYEGKSGSNDCARQGRIPGAVWVEWSEFLDSDGLSFQAPEKLGVMLLQKGITPDKQIVTYCHRGARSAMVWAALDQLGFPKVKNYIGSWHDWAGKKELPAE